MEFVSPICLLTCCRLEYIKLGSPNDPTWSEFPQTLTQTQGARRYVTLFESPFVDSGLSEMENNALRASSLLVVPPSPPDVQPLEGLQGTNLTEANLTQWASYVQDVALGMQRPPRAAMDCPNQDIAGVLHRLENLTGVGFCHLCYALGNTCGCAGATYQAPHGYGSMALWTPPKPSYASMASSTMTTASTSIRGVSPTMRPPPGFPAIGVPTPMDVSPGYNLLAHAGVGRGLQPQSAPGSARPWAPGTVGLHQPWPSAPVNQLLPQEVKRHIRPPHTSRQYTHLGRWSLPLLSPRLKLLLARVRVWLRGEDHKPGSKEVTRNRPLIPEQERIGPPPKDLRSKGVLQARIRWRTSWTLCPLAGRGISCT